MTRYKVEIVERYVAEVNLDVKEGAWDIVQDMYDKGLLDKHLWTGYLTGVIRLADDEEIEICPIYDERGHFLGYRYLKE